MKETKKTCVIYLSLLLFASALPPLEGKTIECVLDRETEKTLYLPEFIGDQTIEQPFGAPQISLGCKQLTIENIGDKVVTHLSPYVNERPKLSIKQLRQYLSTEEYPLLALYDLWNQSVICDKNSSSNDSDSHPLDILRFKGHCSQTDYALQFLKLCNAVGIAVHSAHTREEGIYDFSLGGESLLFGPKNRTMYFGWDNETLISSEEVMDDPLLALRTQQARVSTAERFSERWKRLSQFTIIEPSAQTSLTFSEQTLGKRPRTFALYPNEKMVYKTALACPLLAPHECSINHVIDLQERCDKERCNKRSCTYSSFFPIEKIINNSSAPIQLLEQNVIVKPGSSFIFDEPDLFHLHIACKDSGAGPISVCGTTSLALFPSLVAGENRISFGAKKNTSAILFRYETEETRKENIISPPQVVNNEESFNYCSPHFFIAQGEVNTIETIWWQIALDKHFHTIPSNFDCVETYKPLIDISPLSETFFNSDTTYYFRVKGSHEGIWSDWSTPYLFTVKKPNPVEVILFEEAKKGPGYELNWERYAEAPNPSLEYLVFGSNSFDFIPSIYSQTEVNAIAGGKIEQEDNTNNLIGVTTKPKITVSGNLAYYRIIAREKGQLSVPSPITHVYDQDLVQPRSVLQMVEDEGQFLAKRELFPSLSHWRDIALPPISQSIKEQLGSISLQSLFRSLHSNDRKHLSYELPDVSKEIWEEVKPYLLPENHPATLKLHRIFTTSRAVQSPREFKKAGFRRWRPGKYSRVCASAHPECPGYFIKTYCDDELGIIYDWKKWIHRIHGAETIRACIKEHQLQDDFSVPHKWLYPLPKHPSPSQSRRHVRKNFILVCDDMRILPHSSNEKMYKTKISAKRMKGIYTILQVCGLYDSTFIFNIPFCKDGRIAIIDTEYHHKWPIPYFKLTKYFPKSLQSYWKSLTLNGGKIPNGVSEPNPPRMDRRDVR